MKSKIVMALVAVVIMSSVAMGAVVRIDSLEVVYDINAKLLWQDNSDANTIKKDWQGAMDYCENLSLAGYSDWKLPSKEELLDLLKNENSLKNVYSEYYWSSTTVEYFNDHASVVGFSVGYVSNYKKYYNYYVRCVRAGQLKLDSLDIKIQEQIKAELKRQEQLKQEQLIKQAEELKKQEQLKQEKLKKQEQLKQEELKKQEQLKQEELKKQELKKQDEALYNKTSTLNTTKAYKEYLQNFPNGKYASSARSNLQRCEEEDNFQSLLYSESPQLMYIEAGKEERNGSESRATKLYEAIINRFPTSDFAVRASDKLTGANRMEQAESNRRSQMEQAESNRRSQSRRECENNKNACLAGCGIYIFDSRSHNNAVGSCRDKCEQMSCY